MAAETLPISFINSFSFNKTPLANEAWVAWAMNSLVLSSNDLPVARDRDCIPINSSFVKPAVSLNCVKVFKSSLFNATLVPKVLLIATILSDRLLTFARVAPDSKAWFLSSFLIFCASL